MNAITVDFTDSEHALFFAPESKGKDDRATGQNQFAHIGVTERGGSGPGMMPVVCTWCGVSLGSVPARGDIKVSHGICQVCAENFAREIGA